MRATKAFILVAFERYNLLCFGGKLPPVRMEIANSVKRLGVFRFPRRRSILHPSDPSQCSIWISGRYDFPDEDILTDIVIHEMIHYYIWLSRIRDDGPHGRQFRNIMAAINSKYGRNISVRAPRMADSIIECKSGDLFSVCVTEWKDGEQLVTVSALTRVYEIDRLFRDSPRVVSLQWYQSNDPWFGGLPRVRTARAFRVNLAELAKHLVNALPLDLHRK